MPPTQSFDVTLRAERAEAAAVELRARLQSRTVEAHTSLIGVRHADDLTAACEASLKWQLRQVANYMAELSHERAVGGEQREAEAALGEARSEASALTAAADTEASAVVAARRLAVILASPRAGGPGGSRTPVLSGAAAGVPALAAPDGRHAARPDTGARGPL